MQGVEPAICFWKLHPNATCQILFFQTTFIRQCQIWSRSIFERSYFSPTTWSLAIESFLTGPPGNGKTSLAEALARELMLPLLVVRYEAVIASYLGETALRLNSLFDQIRPLRCVVFFDEFDVLGKERGDTHETGEIKRVVSSLLLQVDGLPSHVVTVAATNHPELLDRAVWRRFQIRLNLPPPRPTDIDEWMRRFEGRTPIRFGELQLPSCSVTQRCQFL